MKTAAVSELKASLSRYLSQVKAGEEVLVTDRGRPIAKIIPLPARPKDLPPHLLELERAGKIRIGTGKLSPGFWKWKRPKDPQGLVLEALLEERRKGR